MGRIDIVGTINEFGGCSMNMQVFITIMYDYYCFGINFQHHKSLLALFFKIDNNCSTELFFYGSIWKRISVVMKTRIDW